jgi:DnaK suppressor protein
MARKDSLQLLRDVLLKRREALKRALDGDLSLLKELREQTKGDVVDFALDSAQDEISSQLAEVESRDLTNIDAALERMKTGAYGKCEGCKSNIPLARLQALPYATCCIECQRRLEKIGVEPNSVDWSNLLNSGMSGGDSPIADLEMEFLD